MKRFFWFLALSVVMIQFAQAQLFTQRWRVDAAAGTHYPITGDTYRGAAYNRVTDHYLVANRTFGTKIYVHSAATGALLDSLNTGIISGGTLPIVDIEVTSAGVIYASNLILNTGSDTTFKIYRWENETATPTLAFSGRPGTARLGDAFDVAGSGTGTVIYASGNNAASVIQAFTTVDGINFTLGTPVPIQGQEAGAGIAQVTPGGNAWISRFASLNKVDLVNTTGTKIDSIESAIAGVSTGDLYYFTVGARKFLAIAPSSRAGGTFGNTEGARLIEVTSGGAAATYIDTTARLSANGNSNASGDVDVKVHGDSVTVFYLIGNNGIAAASLKLPLPPGQLLFEQFEGPQFPPAGWSTYIAAGDSGWRLGTNAPFSGTRHAYNRYQPPGTLGSKFLVTQRINVPSASEVYELSFWLRRAFTSAFPPDTVYVKISTTDSLPGSFTQTIYKCYTGTIADTATNPNIYGTVYRRFKTNITGISGPLFIAFDHQDNDGQTIYLDDVKLELSAAVRDIGVASIFRPSSARPMGINGEDVVSRSAEAERSQKASIELSLPGASYEAPGIQLVHNPLDGTVMLKARVANYGGFEEASYQVGWSINGVAQTPVANSRPLAVGGFDTLALNWATPTSGIHVARAWTIMAGDVNAANDTSAPFMFEILPTNIIWQETFADTIRPAGWRVVNVDGNTPTNPIDTAWSFRQLVSFTGGGTVMPQAGASFWFDNFNSANPARLINDWLISPRINAATFDSLYFYSGSIGGTYPDSLKVFVSTTGNNPGDFTTQIGYFRVPGPIGSWHRFGFNLAPFSGQNIYIAVNYYIVDGGPSGNSSDNVWVDHFFITGTATANRDLGIVSLTRPTAPEAQVISGGGDEDAATIPVADIHHTSEDVANAIHSNVTHAATVVDVPLNGGTFLFTTVADADTVRFRAIVQNFGTGPETTYQVRWDANGVVQGTLNNTRILQPAARDTFSFQWPNTPAGSHVVRAWTLLANDINRSNDTGSVSFSITAPPTVIYSNGSLSTGPVSKSGVSAPAGRNWSEVQNPSGDTTQSNSVAGFSAGITTTTRFRLADNFTVPTGQTWRIDSIFTYAYQTGNAGVTSPFIFANVRIWNGMPDTLGSTVVFGDTLTNRLGTSVFSGLYRIFNSKYPTGSTPGTTRPIWKNTLLINTTLGPGTYWLDWQTQITASAAHFAPSVTVVGRRGLAGWNGRQYGVATPSGWQDLIDAGNPATAPDSLQDMPFDIIGAVDVTPPAGWTAQTSGVTNSMRSVKALSASKGWIGANGGVVLRTTNGGANWQSVGGGAIGTGNVHCITALDENNAVLGSTPSTTAYIFRTTNGGTSWDTVYQQPGGFFNAVHMFNANDGVALGDPVGGTWTILRTTNGGATWSRIATEPVQQGTEAGWVNAFQALNTNVWWFGTNNSRIYRTTDGGATWTSAATSFANSYAVWFNDAQYGVAGSSTGAVARSTDGGTTWVDVPLAGSGGIYGVAGAGVDYWIPRGNMIYRSTDRGLTWNSEYTSTIGTSLRPINMVRVGNITTGWVASTTGGIAQFYGALTDVEEQVAEVPTAFSLLQNYPNPFNPTTTISYSLPQTARVTLSVYNLLGQRVAELTNEVQNAGNYTIVWNGRNLDGMQVSSGVYFYRIEASPVGGGQPFVNLKKMMLLK